MSDEVLVSVENVSKKFCRSLKRSLWYGVRDMAGELFGRNGAAPHLRPDEFWAVREVSFELRRGESLGLIGKNGAGKSTLLKMLNGLIKPDGGRITMRGRVGALIELGAGFNPILTGRENIYINGAVLGFTRTEIDRKFDAIVEFAELDEFLDMPIQSYSSGMKVRLGFAVAAQMEPDVLLIDEVLAVGDVGFRTKCFNAVGEIVKNAAVIFVSHSMPQVARVSSEVMVLNSGQSVYHSKDVPGGIERYYDLFESEKTGVSGSGKVQLHDVQLYSNEENRNEKVPRIKYLDDLSIELTFSLDKEVEDYFITLIFYDKELRSIAQCTSRSTNALFSNDDEFLHARIRLPQITFAPGAYTLTVSFFDEWREFLGRYQAAREFRIAGSHVVGFTPILLNGEWKVGGSPDLQLE